MVAVLEPTQTSADDRGVIALVGERFATPPYDECLPADWYRVDPRELITDDPGAAAAEFWRSFGGAEQQRDAQAHVGVGVPELVARLADEHDPERPVE